MQVRVEKRRHFGPPVRIRKRGRRNGREGKAWQQWPDPGAHGTEHAGYDAQKRNAAHDAKALRRLGPRRQPVLDDRVGRRGEFRDIFGDVFVRDVTIKDRGANSVPFVELSGRD